MGFVEAMESLQAKFAETGEIDTFLLTEGPAGRRDYFVGVLITAESSEIRWSQLESGARWPHRAPRDPAGDLYRLARRG